MPSRSRAPHCEHAIGHGDYAEGECCICIGTPCGVVTVPDMLAHVEYDKTQAERWGQIDARQQISDEIAKAAPADRPLDAPDAAYEAAAEAFRACWVIARGDIDNPPF